VDSLIENLLKIEATDHRKIQEEIQKNLKNLGYEVKLEKKIWAGREGKVDVFARKGNFSVGIEIDHSQLRKKSIEKLNTLKPTLAIFLLKARKINYKEIYSRARSIRVKALLIHLARKRINRLGPYFFQNRQFWGPKKEPKRVFRKTGR